ncbi:MAG: PQQ-binding-like beta-propeller repeat protein [Anaerolineales bacterium]|nr:PQQ-binding-like beta-propeller repeat protein [Anaerolineales bacterium]
MNTRTGTTILFAVLMIILVMGVAALMSFTGWVGSTKFSAQEVWQKPYLMALSMKIIDVTGDGQDDLFIQNDTNLSILDGSGNLLLEKSYPAPLVTTMGDVNGDSREDVVALYRAGSGANVAMISKGEEILQAEIVQFNDPARTAIIRYADGAQVILGDQGGILVAIDLAGSEVWYSTQIASSAVRGLDDILIGNQMMLAVANEGGSVAAMDSQGQTLWSYNLPGGLRRLRAYDLDGDGNSEVLLGGENGGFIILNAVDGAELFATKLGQPISEIREAEVDGDPSSREVVLGGKDGGVWAYQMDGKRLWSASLSDKVTEIASVDLDEDGAEEVIIGDDSGKVTLFTGPSGDRHSLGSYSSGIARIDVGRLTAGRQIAIADGSNLHLQSLEFSSLPPLKFTPLLGGLLVSVVIALAAWFIATNPPKPALKVSLEDQSAESLQSQRRMLKESIADVERLRQAGEMTSNAYLARLKDLRGQLADNEAAMKKAGLPYTPETFQCPNCGGTLELGMDRCEYCGQVVIS